MLTLSNALKDVRHHIDEQLSQLLPLPSGSEKRVVEAMRYSSIGAGKALRPFLIMETASMFGVPQTNSVRLAAAVEMVHSYSLIHDDLPSMDDSDLRRGKPSCHKQFDEATAILAGDGLLTRAFEIVASDKTCLNPSIRCELITMLAHSAGFYGMIAGQMMDLAAEQSDDLLPLTEILRLQSLKTGKILIFCCEAGAVLGKASFEQRQLLKTYASDIGIAFQMTDDLLDFQGDTKKVGKTLHKDINKATYLSVEGPEKTRAKARELITHSLETLKHFGDKALLLRELSLFILNRDY